MLFSHNGKITDWTPSQFSLVPSKTKEFQSYLEKYLAFDQS
jgi:hypothetical protein